MEPPETYWLQNRARTVRQINGQSARRIRRLCDRLRHALRQSLGSPGRNHRRQRRKSAYQRRRQQDHLACELQVTQPSWLLGRAFILPQAAKIVRRVCERPVQNQLASGTDALQFGITAAPDASMAT